MNNRQQVTRHLKPLKQRGIHVKKNHGSFNDVRDLQEKREVGTSMKLSVKILLREICVTLFEDAD